MANIKHVGRMKNNNAKVLVVFRTLPGEPYHALVLGTSGLSDSYHDAIINLVETTQAQDVNEFGDILGIRYFPDGRPMLAALHQDGKLIKVQTTDVVMTPNTTDAIPLDQLNLLIAEQKGMALDDMALEIGSNNDAKVENIAKVEDLTATNPAEPEVVSSEPPSASVLRSRADAMYKEAAKLRKQADELDPPKKRASKATATVDA